MSEDTYYDLMCNFGRLDTFEEVNKHWFKCFSYILLRLCKHYNREVIKDLFINFSMENWGALHREVTEYSDTSKEELKEEFDSECNYIADRISYDRLFRTHWLFRQVYEKELWDLMWGTK